MEKGLNGIPCLPDEQLRWAWKGKVRGEEYSVASARGNSLLFALKCAEKGSVEIWLVIEVLPQHADICSETRDGSAAQAGMKG